jgi:hypothetical protein
MANKGSNVAESHNEGRVADVTSLVAVTDHQNNLNKEVQTGNKRIKLK